MIDENIKCSFTEIPFKSSLSFEYLIAYIENIARNAEHPLNESAVSLLKSLDEVPGLKESITDFSIVKNNQKLVNRLMAFVFNPLNDNIELSSASSPFFPKSFYATKLYDDTFRGENKTLEIAKDFENNKNFLVLIYQAYLIILNKIYNFDLEIDIPFTFKLTDENDGSVKYYKMLVNSKYTVVKVHGKLKNLSQQEIKGLFDHTTDLDYWNEIIPLGQFEFSGFLKFTFVDITHEYVISQMKSDLLDKNAIISQAGFEQIKQKVRALMDIPNLDFGLAAFSDFDSVINQNVIWKSIIPQSEVTCNDYEGTQFEKAYREQRIVVTDDMLKVDKSTLVDAFLKRGIRSHAVVPLMLDQQIVGMMEFGSKEPGQLHMAQIKRFHELFPVFAIALKRSKDELDDRVQAIIQEECTAIHPTVEWRFYEAASHMLDSNLKGELQKMEPIVFNDVVPIYGASDIRNSSVERNIAIQSDLAEHLLMAKDILMKGMKNKEMPLLDHLVYKIDKHLRTVNAGLKAGDEVSLLEFLRKQIEPVFLKLKDRDASMAKEVEQYFNKMDPDLGVLYKKRRDFEDSLGMINDKIGKILDQEQVKAQQVFPHYFEKYRTDGLEYNAYIGQSMVKNFTFDEIYLKNIRLWQLMVKVEIARKVRELMPSLKTQLDVTQLILVHSNPLSIAFREDEKKFDVAGAYNIRYEITKKRIDKAVIKGTRERVTQVGKIAIIYSHAEEIEEYLKYIDYMMAKGYLKGEVEDFELEDLKGASGLRALRVEVDYGNEPELNEISISEIKEVIEAN